jgi:RNA polymerase sigma-70 factor (ECF subfamily)
MDEFRRGRREQRDLAELELIPADGLDVPERRAAMQEAFAQLSPDERAVLYLFSVQGMSGAEISALLGISVGAVRMRIARAREHFRQAYGGAA